MPGIEGGAGRGDWLSRSGEPGAKLTAGQGLEAARWREE
jgi:hypothetical protein